MTELEELTKIRKLLELLLLHFEKRYKGADFDAKIVEVQP